MHSTPFNCTPLRSIQFHSTPLPFLSFPFHSNPIHSVPFYSIPFLSITFPFRSIPFHSNPIHSVPLPSFLLFLYRCIRIIKRKVTEVLICDKASNVHGFKCILSKLFVRYIKAYNIPFSGNQQNILNYHFFHFFGILFTLQRLWI